MKSLVGALGSIFVVGLAASASGQTFAEYFIGARNITDPGRGTGGDLLVGDVLRVSLRVNHDGLSYAGGKVEIRFGGVDGEDITLTEDGFAFPFDPWELGREPIFRIVVSDGPSDATRPHNEDVVASAGKITDVNDNFFDFASTPPGLGGLSASFPLESGEAIFVFDYVYRGGIDTFDPVPTDTARLWRDQSDINGAVVDATAGDTFPIGIPAPATSVALLVGLGSMGRRRRSIER